MPTMSFYKLVIQGPPARLTDFRADDTVWRVEPWRDFFGGPELREDNAASGQLVYLWADDYKRPGPSVGNIAAGHPQLSMTLEWSDESGGVAERVHYLDGAKTHTADVDPYELEWMEWEEDDD